MMHRWFTYTLTAYIVSSSSYSHARTVCRVLPMEAIERAYSILENVSEVVVCSPTCRTYPLTSFGSTYKETQVSGEDALDLYSLTLNDWTSHPHILNIYVWNEQTQKHENLGITSNCTLEIYGMNAQEMLTSVTLQLDP